MHEESTTPDLVELTRRIREALNHRDFDAVMRFYAPDAVLQNTEIGTFEGEAAIRGVFEDLMGSYEEWAIEAEESINLGQGVTFVVLRGEGRPVGSSGYLRFRFANISIWSDGVIERETTYIDIDEARAPAERLAEERE